MSTKTMRPPGNARCASRNACTIVVRPAPPSGGFGAGMGAGCNSVCVTDGSASSTPVATNTNSKGMLQSADSLCTSRSRRIGAASRLNASALRQLPRGHHATTPLISSSSRTTPDHPTT
ncbi:hypothetical protein QP165_03105 [Sphingomonas sp. 22R3R2A-7]